MTNLLGGGVDADDGDRAAMQHVFAVQPSQVHLRHRRLGCAGRPKAHRERRVQRLVQTTRRSKMEYGCVLKPVQQVTRSTSMRRSTPARESSLLAPARVGSLL